MVVTRHHDVTLAEGNAGTTAFNFSVTLSNASFQTVTVTANTANGTATLADNDYQQVLNQLVTFNPGQPLTQTFTVTINGDKQKESDEYFEVVLSGASSNALIWDAYGLGTILTDDPGKGPGKGPGKP